MFTAFKFLTGLAQLVEHWSQNQVSGVRVSQPVLKIISLMITVLNYIKESFDELRNNVSWTPINQLQKLTVVVLLFSLIFSVAIWGADTVLSSVITSFLN